MKKIIFMQAVVFFAAAVFAMSKPKEEVFMEEPASKGTEKLTGYPVYIGNAPFERLAVEIPQKNGGKILYQIEIPEGSKITEKELSDFQGYEVQFTGKIKDEISFLGVKIFVISGYKANRSVK